ncbi:energy transducer TonB [Pseudoalteromonas luteoviolacea]|uniref:TonB C-terminal domain-containing protein n=1 Tax=Pseudoalteromonas luteoviolacea H33 TaxID=1365251 RepID=A0A167D4V2_9GAMM|nr:energy transducer TonB [Pseudoalteromonas luteoviolacea]KZN48416.1 hypothetical protein N476_21330 [Pseudoalteromonas luteoviolacea H33]KZN73277.1 hypothetical protein N477_23430 [Pseudoalteromonas luteoviolacea H33-S]
MNLISAMLLSVASSQAGEQSIDETNDVLKGTIINAVPVEKAPPYFPTRAANQGREGWVQLSYVVNEKGEVESAVVEKSSGYGIFERAALRAVEKWTFEPALQNNKPVKQCQNQVHMNFHLAGVNRTVTRQFLRRYKAVVAKIDANELDDVPALLQEMESKGLQNLTEDSYFWVAKARFYNVKANKLKELQAIEQVMLFGEGVVKEQIYNALLARATLLNIEQNRFENALETYALLSKSKKAEKATSQLAPYIDKLKEFIADESKHIWVKGQVEKSLWVHKLVRNAFSISDIQGNLNTLEVRCDNQFSTYEVKTGLQWNIPKSWQGCQVYVYGEQGASFNLVETAAAKKV